MNNKATNYTHIQPTISGNMLAMVKEQAAELQQLLEPVQIAQRDYQSAAPAHLDVVEASVQHDEIPVAYHHAVNKLFHVATSLELGEDAWLTEKAPEHSKLRLYRVLEQTLVSGLNRSENRVKVANVLAGYVESAVYKRTQLDEEFRSEQHLLDWFRRDVLPSYRRFMGSVSSK